MRVTFLQKKNKNKKNSRKIIYPPPRELSRIIKLLQFIFELRLTYDKLL
jgi:hypothetical protein